MSLVASFFFHPSPPLVAVGARLKANFGFMFSFTGRTLFILFCGTIAFALSHWLGYIFGSLTFRE